MPQSDRLVAFVFSHQTLIIEGIFATILGIIVVWLFANLGEENEKNSPNESEELKAMLKKVLASGVGQGSNISQSLATASAPPKLATPIPTTPSMVGIPTTPTAPKIESLEAKPAAKPVPVEPATLTAQIANPSPIVVTTTVGDAAEALKLKNEIDNRNKKVDELEKALTQARDDLSKMQDTSKNTESLEQMRKQIAKLEGRLREYAIIEDDIANLSAYKDENDKLKTEIALLKKKGMREDSDAPLSTNSISAEITAAPLSMTPRAGDSAPSWPINEGESKKLLNEFDSLMNTQIKSATDETIDQSEANDGEKLIAEFQNFMKGTPG